MALVVTPTLSIDEHFIQLFSSYDKSKETEKVRVKKTITYRFILIDIFYRKNSVERILKK